MLTCTDVVGCEESTGTSGCSIPSATNIWTAPDDSETYPTLGAGGIFGYTYLAPAQKPILFTNVPATGPPRTVSRPTSKILPPPPPPYATGRCNVHVREVIEDRNSLPTVKTDVYLHVDITDAKGVSIGSASSSGLKWGETFKVESKVADILYVTPHGNYKYNKRDSIRFAAALLNRFKKRIVQNPYRPAQEKGPVNFVLGAQSWDSTSEQCSTGKYDNGNFKDELKSIFLGDHKLPNRQMDCKFDC